ncbi:hypothetical protein [Geminocystis herdmanii]|uniref:hypothetical protein n=1 Tax=Geminocystis herdmanii TaxID=669359 RepID=UPI00034D0407|nr:hypothetical protein [Geminocystis herdmanii]
MISVKVVSKSTGKPVSGKRVQLGFEGNWLPGGMSSDERTNSEGEAHFDNDPGKGIVYVDGSNVHKGDLRGRVVVYI